MHDALIKAALDVFGETATAAFVVPIPHTTPALFIACGERSQIASLLAAKDRCQCPACAGATIHASDCSVHGYDSGAGIVRGSCDCAAPAADKGETR